MFKSVLIAAALAVSAALAPGGASAGDGLIAKKSANSFEATVARLETALGERSITVFNKIDHAAGAASTGQTLRPTTLIIFGNPAIGAPLMAMRQSIGLDLPLKALVCEDEAGAVWVIYNDMRDVARRHGIEPGSEPVERIAGGLKAITDYAVAAPE